MGVGVVGADQDTESERSIGYIAYTLVAGQCAASIGIISKIVDWAV